jgi:hypothetical protein
LHEKAKALMVQQTIQTIATTVFVLFASPIAGAIGANWWYGLGACLSGFCFFLTIFFVPETKYNRDLSAYQDVGEENSQGSTRIGDSTDDKALELCTDRPELDLVTYQPKTWRSDLRLWVGKPEWKLAVDMLVVSSALSSDPRSPSGVCRRLLTMVLFCSKLVNSFYFHKSSGQCVSTASCLASTSASAPRMATL